MSSCGKIHPVVFEKNGITHTLFVPFIAKYHDWLKFSQLLSYCDFGPGLNRFNCCPFKSKSEGCMHACGHDIHMATIWGTAKVLSRMKDKIHGSVRFICQPAEEFPPGGAKEMIEKGCLKNVSMIFGPGCSAAKS